MIPRLRSRIAGHPRQSAADSGFATIVVLGLAGALLSFGALLATLGAVAVARHRAGAAADLAALAAAGHLLEGAGPACSAASRVAGAQGASVLSCSLDGEAVTVVAEVRPAGSLGRFGAARSTARAGPGRSPGVGGTLVGRSLPGRVAGEPTRPDAIGARHFRAGSSLASTGPARGPPPYSIHPTGEVLMQSLMLTPPVSARARLTGDLPQAASR